MEKCGALHMNLVSHCGLVRKKSSVLQNILLNTTVVKTYETGSTSLCTSMSSSPKTVRIKIIKKSGRCFLKSVFSEGQNRVEKKFSKTSTYELAGPWNSKKKKKK